MEKKGHCCGIVVALLHPCRDRSSNQREVWGVDSQLCKRSSCLQLGPVKVWAARCFCTESLSKLALLHDSALAVDHGYRLLLSKST